MHKCVFYTVLAFLLIAGCGGNEPGLTEEEPARIALAEASDGFVLAVAGETITSDEIIETPVEHNGMVVPLTERLGPIAQSSNDFESFKEQARPELERIITTRISNILLYQLAKRQAGQNIDKALEKAAEAELRKIIVSEFGGDVAKVDEKLKEEGMDRKSFKEKRKKLILIESYIASQLPKDRPVTYSQLLDYYNKVKDEFYFRPATIKFQLIDIEVAKVELADPNQNQLEKARELANELTKRIRTDEDFRTLAEQYPGVSFARYNDPVRPENLEKPYDVLALEAEKIEPGQIAEPIESVDKEHIFIMKLEEKHSKGYEPFEKVQKKIEAQIIFDRQKQAFDELGAKLRQQARLGQSSEFIDFCLKEIYRMSN